MKTRCRILNDFLTAVTWSVVSQNALTSDESPHQHTIWTVFQINGRTVAQALRTPNPGQTLEGLNAHEEHDSRSEKSEFGFVPLTVLERASVQPNGVSRVNEPILVYVLESSATPFLNLTLGSLSITLQSARHPEVDLFIKQNHCWKYDHTKPQHRNESSTSSRSQKEAAQENRAVLSRKIHVSDTEKSEARKPKEAQLYTASLLGKMIETTRGIGSRWSVHLRRVEMTKCAMKRAQVTRKVPPMWSDQDFKRLRLSLKPT